MFNLTGVFIPFLTLFHQLLVPGIPAASTQTFLQARQTQTGALPYPQQTPEPWPTPAIYFDPPTWEQQSHLYVRNDQAYDLTLTLDFETLVNLSSEPSLPITITAKAYSTTRVSLLTVDDPAHFFDVYVKVIKAHIGPLNAIHNDQQIYRLPYESKTSHKVLQGYSGRFSHLPPLLQYALDFDLTEGSKILAARAGRVARVIDSYQGFGTHPDFQKVTNLIYVQHADGTFGRYLHLKYKGAKVKEGQEVKAGDLLGLSGNTGYSTMPHLHFDVFKALDETTIQTIPVRFQTKESGVTSLKEAYIYTAP